MEYLQNSLRKSICMNARFGRSPGCRDRRFETRGLRDLSPVRPDAGQNKVLHLGLQGIGRER